MDSQELTPTPLSIEVRMRYHAPDQINKAYRLQDEACAEVASALRKLKESDELINEIKREIGDRFVCNGIAYRIDHKAVSCVGILSGNRDWIQVDSGIRIIT